MSETTPETPETNPEETTEPQTLTLSSSHSANMGPMFGELGISVMVTTYQAGRLVILERNDQGTLNNHFCQFVRPMGLAIYREYLALGNHCAIDEFHDLPAVARNIKTPGSFDAAYLPRMNYHTGEIQIHEMAWLAPPPGVQNPELIFVNTRFSCLCRREMPYSFTPIWRPRFISAIAPEDRCHLNGLGLRDNRPWYATALGESDTRAGWRENKKDGGILIDIQADEIIARGLSMPHSPRWYNGRLWVLNSGFGSFGTIDLATGKYIEVARLPGFTRGLDFFGNLAFIGLSQVRESATFSGIEIADRPLEERCCGMWVVDIQTGQTVGMVKFGDALQEIFAVAVLPRRRAAVVTENQSLLEDSFVLPDAALLDVEQSYVQR
jgi:uncharacterized protein (TIGR03032 family)